MGRMLKTTVYLPATLLRSLKAIARDQELSEAEVIRRAIDEYTARNSAGPTLVIDVPGIPSDLAERDEDYLEGFGRD